MIRYQNYIFDLYGTLIDILTDEEDPAFWETVAQIYACYGCGYDGVTLMRTYRRMVRVAEEELRRATGVLYPEICLENVFWELLLQGRAGKEAEVLPDRETFLYGIANTFRVLSRKRLTLLPGTIETLDTLRKRGAGIYLLSNAQQIFTVPEMEQMGILSYFDEIYISSAHGMRKPQKEFLENLLEEQGLDRSTCLMVGNDPETDLAIAKACGVDGCLIRPGESIAKVL